jgi:hypothetical protein
MVSGVILGAFGNAGMMQIKWTLLELRYMCFCGTRMMFGNTKMGQGKWGALCAYSWDENVCRNAEIRGYHPGEARMTCGRSPHHGEAMTWSRSDHHDFGEAKNMLRFANHKIMRLVLDNGYPKDETIQLGQF